MAVVYFKHIELPGGANGQGIDAEGLTVIGAVDVYLVVGHS
jgi:hypothetical protein